MDPRARNSDRTGMDGPGFPLCTAALGVSGGTATVFFGGLCELLMSELQRQRKGGPLSDYAIETRVGGFVSPPLWLTRPPSIARGYAMLAGEMLHTVPARRGGRDSQLPQS